jgi:hypothetical protein
MFTVIAISYLLRGAGCVALGLEFFLAVLGMCADPFNQYQIILIAHLDHESVGVALDVKDHPVVGQKVGAAVAIFDVLRASPTLSFNVDLPRVELSTGISVFGPECFKKG